MVGNGKICRSKQTPCDPNPCYKDTECIVRNGTFECGICPNGTIGDGFSCEGMSFIGTFWKLCLKMICGNLSHYNLVLKISIYVLEINDCREDSCYPGVKCIDLMAPKRGFKCDKCPEGFTGNGMSCEKQGKWNF